MLGSAAMGLQGRTIRPRRIRLSYAARELAIQRDLERLAEERTGESEALTRSESRQGVRRDQGAVEHRVHLQVGGPGA